jgi:hypothetical protein
MTHTNPNPPGHGAPPPHGAGAPLHNPEVAHEHSDVNVRTILMYGVGLLVIGVIVHILMWVLFAVFERQAAANDPPTSPLAAPATQMPASTTASPYFGTAAGPQLLTNEPAVLMKHRAAEQQQLHTGGWVNQAGGVARIPIEDAKKLLVQQGLPVREDGPVAPTLGTRAAAAGEASSGRTVPTGREPAETQPPPGEQPPRQPEEPARKPGG